MLTEKTHHSVHAKKDTIPMIKVIVQNAHQNAKSAKMLILALNVLLTEQPHHFVIVQKELMMITAKLSAHLVPHNVKNVLITTLALYAKVSDTVHQLANAQKVTSKMKIKNALNVATNAKHAKLKLITVHLVQLTESTHQNVYVHLEHTMMVKMPLVSHVHSNV
jgi:hypothetical protein